MVTFDLSLSPKIHRKPPRKIWQYKKSDSESLEKYLTEFSETFLLEAPSRSVQENWNVFKTALKTGMEKYIPTKMTKNKTSLPWITHNIKKEMRKKDKLHKLANRTHKNRLYEAYRHQRTKVNKLIRQAHNNYINNIIGNSFKDNPKLFWSYIKSNKVENVNIPTLISNSGETCNSDKAKATALNNQFQSVFTDEDFSNFPTKGQTCYRSAPELSIHTNGVYKLLIGLDCSKATGPDEIPARILHDYAGPLSKILSFLYQQSYDTGTIPQDWRDANICAIYKKGHKSRPENYRPVSLTCISCKLMEHIVLSHLSSHLNIHNILAKNQHGFRPHLSCETQLVEAVHDWASTLDASGQVDVILLDFSKAFDKVPHSRLLHKLDYYGVRGSTLSWIKSFLSGRRQRVVVNGSQSEWCDVTSGVPQGSVLGPSLFLVFINDIIDDVSSPIRLFADDSIIYRNINSAADHQILQSDVFKLFDWSTRWQMSFNVQKCYVISITRKTTKKSNFIYKMSGQTLPVVPSSKYLGITVSEKLKWSEHIKDITSGARKVLGLLERNLSQCPQKVKQSAYFALVRPKLEYSSPAWNPYIDKDVNNLEKVQRRAARFVSCDYSQDASVTSMLSKLGWDSLECRRTLASLALFYKIQNGLVNISFPAGVVPKRHTRSTSGHPYQYIQLSPSKDSYRYSFYVRTIPLWNSLSVNTVCCENVHLFKDSCMAEISSLSTTVGCKRI